MSASWAVPGAKCVCIRQFYRNGGSYTAACELAVVGKIYTIRAVAIVSGEVGILLEEIVNPIGDMSLGIGGETAFRAEGFRPLISRTQAQDLQLFVPLLTVVGEPA